MIKKSIIKVLIVYKRSAYQNYFLEKKSFFYHKQYSIAVKEMKDFRENHLRHYAVLKYIEQFLLQYNISYEKYPRGKKIPYSHSDVIISVGGDGTFLEAAQGVRNQLILGVNSNPHTSVGRLCTAQQDNFKDIFNQILNQRFHILILHRCRLSKIGLNQPVLFVNDLLLCHNNPAAMSRYSMTIGKRTEVHRNSGLWIATAAGSTGAIHSAGGKVMDITSSQFQYLPRELYSGIIKKYHLKGGILNQGQKIHLTSLMRGGMIFVDGAHLKIPFEYGAQVVISASCEPLKVVVEKIPSIQKIEKYL